MKFYKVLKKPLKTEKTSKLEIDNNTYVFIVSKDATKIDIKKSIYKMYHVEVKSINTLNTREKFKQWKKRKLQSKKKTMKKAYVTLKNEKEKIDFSIVK